MFNTHIHIFTKEDVPSNFLPFKLVRILADKEGYEIIAKVLHNLNPWTKNDVFDRYLEFVKEGRLGSQTNIFEDVAKFYPIDTKFFVLPMDMEYMGAGTTARVYRDQLKELIELSKIDKRVVPFVMVDPRRPEIEGFVLNNNFAGIKLYPNLGYFPYDKDLMWIYNYCSKFNKPIVAHCTPDNPVHFKGSKQELKELLLKSKGVVNLKGSNQKLCAQFMDPYNYVSILNNYKDVNICLAHMGGEQEVLKYLKGEKNTITEKILNLIVTYPNLYTDISYTLSNKKLYSFLDKLLDDNRYKNRILFGSDFYMNKTKGSETLFSENIKEMLGDKKFELISVINVNNFLKI